MIPNWNNYMDIVTDYDLNGLDGLFDESDKYESEQSDKYKSDCSKDYCDQIVPLSLYQHGLQRITQCKLDTNLLQDSELERQILNEIKDKYTQQSYEECGDPIFLHTLISIVAYSNHETHRTFVIISKSECPDIMVVYDLNGYVAVLCYRGYAELSTPEFNYLDSNGSSCSPIVYTNREYGVVDKDPQVQLQSMLEFYICHASNYHYL